MLMSEGGGGGDSDTFVSLPQNCWVDFPDVRVGYSSYITITSLASKGEGGGFTPQNTKTLPKVFFAWGGGGVEPPTLPPAYAPDHDENSFRIEWKLNSEVHVCTLIETLMIIDMCALKACFTHISSEHLHYVHTTTYNQRCLCRIHRD